MSKPYQKAVIMGGSLGGMVTARVLADYFEHVIVLERDHYPAGYEHRKGVPQSKQPHLLLGAGRDALDTLFPGFTERAIANGAILEKPALVMASLEASGWAPQSESPLEMLYSSRLVLDPTIRSFVQEIPHVDIKQGYQVSGLLWNNDNSRVTGVTARNLERDSAELFNADLVVDACGRASRLLPWFKEKGLPPVPRMTLDAKCTYSTCWFERLDGDKRPEHIWWNGMALQPAAADTPAEHQFLGVILPTEHNQWIATIGSWGGYDNMPRDFDSFMAITKKLRTPWFNEALTHTRPVSDVHMTKTTHNFWNRFDQWEKAIGGIVAIGDANQGFNPFYGQGISCCAKGGLILQTLLGEKSIQDHDFHKVFATRLNAYLEIPWSLAKGRDSVIEGAEGTEVEPNHIKRKLMQKIALPFFEAMLRAGRADAYMAQKLDDVINIRISMNEFLANPKVLLKLLWSEIQYKTGLIDSKVTPQDQPPRQVIL